MLAIKGKGILRFRLYIEKILRLRPSIVLTIYLSLIVVYAFLYQYIPGIVIENDWSMLKSFYFSVVTITTLGYGEITPKSNVGMILTSSEAFMGIVIIGWFLNSLWQSVAGRIEKKQEASIAQIIAEQNLRSLASFYKYLSTVISNYQIALAELTIPISKRKGQFKLNPEFIFSDMQDMYKQSLLTKSGFTKSVIRLYFEKQDAFTDELKFLLSNFDLNEYPNIHKLVIDFLTLSKTQDVREALFSNEEIKVGGKFLKDNLEKALKEHDQCPDLREYRSNIITPAIVLYQNLKSQMMKLQLIVEEFEKLLANNQIRHTQ